MTDDNRDADAINREHNEKAARRKASMPTSPCPPRSCGLKVEG